MSANASKTPLAGRDEWRTPRYLFNWLHRVHFFGIDLAATRNNTLCRNYFELPVNALEEDWHPHALVGFCNPPYSRIAPWLIKAIDESRYGFTSVFLIPSPNGEKFYGDHVFGVASEVIFITGRVSFLAPSGVAQSGNRWGSIVAIYRAYDLGATRYKHVLRSEIEKYG